MKSTSATYRGSKGRVKKRVASKSTTPRDAKNPSPEPHIDVFKSAFGKSFVPLLITDRFGRCLEANESVVKLLNRRRSVLQRKTLDAIFTLRGTSTVGGFRARLSHGEALDAEVAFEQKEGKPLRLRLHATILDGELRLIGLARIHEQTSNEGLAVKARGTTALLDEFFSVPWGDEDTDYHSLFQHSPYGIAILQTEKLAVVNPTFCKLLGYRSGEEIVGKEIREFLDDGSRMFFSLLQHRVFRGEAIPMRFETRMLKPGGATVDVETSFALIWYRGAPALNVTIGDITDRKELEKRLTDSESLLRNVINSMVDALVITDLQGKVLDVNDEFQRFTGFSRREAFAAEIPYPWVPEESLGSFMSWLEQLREHNVLRDFDITWLRKNGERVAVSLNTTLLRNATGDPVLMVNIARDISERQASREELSRQLQRLQVLYDLSSALTETLNIQEIARNTYEQVEKVIPVDGFSIDLYDDERREIRPVYAVDLVNGRRAEIAVPHMTEALDKSQSRLTVISTRKPLLQLRTEPGANQLQAVGESTASSLMMVPMVSKQTIIGVLSVHSYTPESYSQEHLTLLQSIAHLAGISVEKAQLYHETVRKSREIEARNKELDDFTYVVSHDLKEPLISVEGYTKMIHHEYQHQLDKGGREYLQAVMDSCQHMKRLIDDLLLLSRISKLTEKRSTIDLAPLINEVLEELRFSIRERKAVIVVQEKLPAIVGVDTHLRIVFRNLIANALKFCDKQIPRIEIGARSTPEGAALFVQDNGIGIEPTHFEKIFLIFQRLHRKDEYEGVGAGLTIVRKIIESSGGKIWVESTLGQGATFFFTMPSA
ncbi:MAG: PAS domain S-box protein [Ignavibacteriales bacterium]|nr:PAS domain S-box protein [Ignavibacteriales bacterium]